MESGKLCGPVTGQKNNLLYNVLQTQLINGKINCIVSGFPLQDNTALHIVDLPSL